MDPIELHSGFCAASIQQYACKEINGLTGLLKDALPFSGNMLEVHLGHEEQRIDYAFRINSYYDAALLRKLSFNGLPAWMQEGYNKLVACPENKFLYGIENIWFEYDQPVNAPPAFFFDLYRNEVFSPEKVWCALQTISIHFNNPLSEMLLPLLCQLKAGEMKALYYGFMLSRNTGGIRLSIDHTRADKLFGLLKTIEWKGNYALLTSIGGKYLRDASRLALALDYDNIVQKKAGIEVHCKSPASLVASLRPFISDKQYSLLTAWEGTVALPASVQDSLTSLHNRTISCIYKRINHFKFVINDNDIKLKAYLYYCF